MGTSTTLDRQRTHRPPAVPAAGAGRHADRMDRNGPLPRRLDHLLRQGRQSQHLVRRYRPDHRRGRRHRHRRAHRPAGRTVRAEAGADRCDAAARTGHRRLPLGGRLVEAPPRGRRHRRHRAGVLTPTGPVVRRGTRPGEPAREGHGRAAHRRQPRHQPGRADRRSRPGFRGAGSLPAAADRWRTRLCGGGRGVRHRAAGGSRDGGGEHPGCGSAQGPPAAGLHRVQRAGVALDAGAQCGLPALARHRDGRTGALCRHPVRSQHRAVHRPPVPAQPLLQHHAPGMVLVRGRGNAAERGAPWPSPPRPASGRGRRCWCSARPSSF